MAGLSKDQVTNLISDEVAKAVSFIDTDLRDRRERILDYIAMRMPDLPAKKGRSRVVDGTVSSQIDLMMPGLVRIMDGGSLLGEYEPTTSDYTDMAREATDYVNDIVMKIDNDGPTMLYNWSYDALTQILGTVKSTWREDIRVTERTLENMTDDEMVAVVFEIEGNGADMEPDPTQEVVAYDYEVDPETGEMLHTFTIETTINESRVIHDNIPPEELLVSADARSADINSSDPPVLIEHRTYKRAGELVEMGYKQSVVDSLPTYEPFNNSEERLSRGFNYNWGSTDVEDKDLRKIAVHQGILHCNYDGKGIKPWYFVAAGNTEATELLEIEPYAYQVAFATFCPKPIPHTVWGRCPGDDLVPIQQAKTVILRQTMDNLYLANTPQRFVNKSKLEAGGLEALINAIPGGVVLTNGMPGEAVWTDAIPFFAEKSFPMLEYQDREAEKRTGMSRSSMALDPDALNDQTATAAKIAETAASTKVETMARIWANGGMTQLFRNTLNILKQFQDYPRRVRIGGEIVSVDPSKWGSSDDWAVTINTGLGTGSRERDMMTLGFIQSTQEKILTGLGDANPFVSAHQLSNTLQDTVYAAGFRTPEKYFSLVDEDYQPPESPPPQPTPDTMVFAETEKLKVQQRDTEDQRDNQTKQVIEAEKLESADMKAARQFQLDEDKIDIEREKLAFEKEKYYGTPVATGDNGEAARESMLLEDDRLRAKDALEARTKIELAGIQALGAAMQGEGAQQGQERMESAMAQARANLSEVMAQPRQMTVQRDENGRVIGGSSA